MNTVDPRWKNGIDFEDVYSLLHIMIRNKDTDVFLILTLPFYGTSSIRKRIQTPIYSEYLPQTFSTENTSPRRPSCSTHPAANYEYILITIFIITQLNLASPREQEYYKSVELDLTLLFIINS
jgi:hypothetical protein